MPSHSVQPLLGRSVCNILLSPPSRREIADILATTPFRSALPPLGAPAWDAARGHPHLAGLHEALLNRALAEVSAPMPVLTDELYADYFKTGDRLPFERPYFERRRRLGRAAVALLLGGDRSALIPSFLEKLAAILDEPSWSVNAHVPGEPTGKNPLVVDLFAAETANNLADLLVVFKSEIPDSLSSRIRSGLRARVFESYVDNHASYPIRWFDSTSNWNAVCHQGVLSAALAVEDDHDLVVRMLAIASRGLPRYLDGFGDDGSTTEGPGYWSYGFGWFSELNARLEQSTGGRLSLFEGHPKIPRIARFAPALCLSGGHLVNFADSGRNGRLNPSLLVYLGRRLGDDSLSELGAFGYRHRAESPPDLDSLRCDFFNLSRLLLRAPSPGVIAAAGEPARADMFFPDYGAVVTRGTDAQGRLWEFAAKGGHNAEHHNHNDCGSFLLNIDGTPALVEIGVGEYTRSFFVSETRYSYLVARSLGHSVPIVNGCEQSAGPEFVSKVLRAFVGEASVEFEVDLTRSYPAEAHCKKLIRTFVFEKSLGRLSIADRFELDGPGRVESLLISLDAPAVQDAEATISLPAGSLHIRPTDGTVISGIEACPFIAHNGSESHVHRLRLTHASSPLLHGKISVEITLS